MHSARTIMSKPKITRVATCAAILGAPPYYVKLSGPTIPSSQTALRFHSGTVTPHMRAMCSSCPYHSSDAIKTASAPPISWSKKTAITVSAQSRAVLPDIPTRHLHTGEILIAPISRPPTLPNRRPLSERSSRYAHPLPYAHALPPPDR